MSKQPRVVIDAALYEEMVAHLQNEYPLEGCGLLAGSGGRVSGHYPVSNRLRSPTAYEMEPKEQLRAMLDMEDRAWELVAVYHSHPHGPEEPSPTDIAKATYPDAAQVIVSFRRPDSPKARAFYVVDGRFDEIELAIV